MIYDLIHLTNYMIMVDKKQWGPPCEGAGCFAHKTKPCDNCKRYQGWPILAATPSLGLPLLPQIEEDAEALANTFRDTYGTEISRSHRYDIKDAFLAGYKAAKAKKYTEEDIRKAVSFGSQLEANVTRMTSEQFFQSLNPLPIAVEVEIEEYNARPDLGNFLFQGDGSDGPLIMKRIKVVNNIVQVKRWIYETEIQPKVP